jgi:HAD superfamily hydrolase (TIGR01509 family)
MPELVIFDCDGVLVDSEPVVNRLFTEALRAVGLNLSWEDSLRQFTGLSHAAGVREVHRLLGRELPVEFWSELDARCYEVLAREVRPMPGAHEFLGALCCQFCVASSGPHEKMAVTLGRTELLPFFNQRIFSATEVARGKPFPDLFLYAAQRMGISPEKAVVIEDSIFGIQAAKAAGMTAIGLVHSAYPFDLLGAGADMVVKSLSDLHRIFSGVSKLYGPLPG